MTHPIAPELLLLPLLLCTALTLIFITFYKHTNAGIRAIVFVSLACLGFRYETWRLMDTLNFDNIWAGTVSLLIFAAELLLFVHFLCCSFLEIKVRDRRAEADAREKVVLAGQYVPHVDVFITTCNEPIEVVSKAIIGCQAMDYPHKTVYLLDDGNRLEMRALCQQYQCRYISRVSNEHYKAGNLNNALAQTKGALVACFDADFIPTRNFLMRTVGFFMDDSVALVQTPQNFYNSDPIEKNLGLFGVITNEQELFFKKVQPSRDAANAVICCGTSFVIRRSALNQVGGFSTVSITEDYLTSIELHAHGYQGVYLNEMLSVGDAPGSIGDYIHQRTRWCRGILQALFSSANPLFRKGLTLKQRVYHFMSIFYWITSLSRIILLMTPLFFLIGGLYPIHATLEGIVFYFLPFYLSYLILENWLSGGKRSPIWSDLYECLVCFPVFITTVSCLLKPFGIPFRVTPKLQGATQISFNVSVAYPLLVMLLLYFLGFVLALKNWSWQSDHLPVIVNVAWGIYNIVILWLAIQICFDVPQAREEIVFVCQQPAALKTSGMTSPVVITEMSSKGVLVEFPQNSFAVIPKTGNPLTIDIPNLQLYHVPVQTGRKRHGPPVGAACVYLHFGALSQEQNRRLIELLFCEKPQWPEQSFRENTYLWNFLKSVFRLYPLTAKNN